VETTRQLSGYLSNAMLSRTALIAPPKRSMPGWPGCRQYWEPRRRQPKPD